MNTKPQTLLEQEMQEILAIAKRKTALEQQDSQIDSTKKIQVSIEHNSEDGLICPVLLAA